jgi:hypothetical protein
VPVTFGALAARDRARRTLFSISFGRWFTLVSNAVAVLALGAYTGDHLGEPHVGVAAALLFVVAVALLVSSIHQTRMLATIDLSAPAVEVAHRVAAAERLRVATDTAVLCASPLLWTLIAVVGARALLGLMMPTTTAIAAFDAVFVSGTPWIVANLVFGLVTLGLGAIFVQPLRRLIAGNTLARVNARLADLARFAAPDAA